MAKSKSPYNQPLDRDGNCVCWDYPEPHAQHVPVTAKMPAGSTNVALAQSCLAFVISLAKDWLNEGNSGDEPGAARAAYDLLTKHGVDLMPPITIEQLERVGIVSKHPMIRTSPSGSSPALKVECPELGCSARPGDYCTKLDETSGRRVKQTIAHKLRRKAAEGKKLFIEIVVSATDTVVKRLGPFESERRREKADAGLQHNLDHEHYYTRDVEEEL